jgi:hypothetical protein
LTTRTTKLKNDVLPSVPGTKEVADQPRYLLDGGLDPLVLIGDYRHLSSVSQWVRLEDKLLKILPA